jgi:hypothetical protein
MMHPQEKTMMPNGQSSEGEKVSEIQALTARVNVLSQSVDLWNLLMLWGLGVALIATAFVFIATRLIITRSGELSATQELLSAAKDRQLSSDLRDKDVKIGDAQHATADISGQLEKERQKTALFQKEADVARLALEARIADEANRAGQLQRIALGRILTDPKVFVKSLEGKPKAKVEVVYPSGTDPEPFSFASQIERWLGSGTTNDGAGWEVKLRPLTEEDAISSLGVRPDAPLVLRAGIWVPGGFAIAASTIGTPGDFTSTASGALMKAFMDCGNGGGNIWYDRRVPSDTLRLVIGPR